MALQTLEGAGLWVPAIFNGVASFGNATYLIDASGEKVAVILACPRSGTLDRFDFLVGVVTNSPDNGLRASFQGVNSATGQPDDTILGATNNAFVTYAHTVTTGWKSTNFGETVTVTRGQLIACVVDIPTFTAGDSVALSSLSFAQNSTFPYSISVLTTKQTVPPIIGLHYTDGYAQIAPGFYAVETLTTVTYAVNTAVADEWGLAFQVPWPCKLSQIGVTLSAAAGANFEVLVYDSADTVISTCTHDGDITQQTGQGQYTFTPTSELTLAANVTYRVTVRPTTTNSVILGYVTFNSAALMQTMEGGDNFYMTSRLNQAGSWTNYNSGTFRRPRISLHLTAFDDGTGGGASINRRAIGVR